jgi:hypothetical protein
MSMTQEKKMAKNPKISQIWTVRNASGEFLGAFHALTADQAIARAKEAAGTYYQTFGRRAAARGGGIKLDDLTAQVE